jgi:hypothetical protein
MLKRWDLGGGSVKFLDFLLTFVGRLRLCYTFLRTPTR